MNIKKMIKIIFAVIIFIVILLLVLYFINSKNYAKTDELGDLKSKISQEIHFLDDYIISMANSVNNINLANYIVKSETILSQTSKESNSSGKEGSSDSENESSSGGNSDSSNNSSDTKSSSTSGEDNNNKSSSYVMEPSDVLVNDRTADWESIKIAVERLYSTWPSIVIDLYKLNVDTQAVQGFSKDLDELTKSVKAQDKAATLMYMAKIYNYLPIFGEYIFDNNLNNNMLLTKANILNAYSIFDVQNWQNIKDYMNKAEEAYMNVLNNANNKNQYNINKAYIMLKEFQISIDTKDIDVLYIKYKNLLDELNIVSI